MPATVLSADQVQALAAGSASLIAARRLAQSGGWRETGGGGDPPSVWGLCQGSGKAPYQVGVDLTGPAYKCSCPSRKFPCKHALALLLRWAAGEVASGEAPQWVQEWHASRASKKAAAKGPRTEAHERAARMRAQARGERIAGGIVELRQWLRDQVRHGIAGLDQAGYRHFEPLAARLVDAQAPGLASWVRGLGAIPSSGQGWEERLLTQLSLLHLLTGGGTPPGELAALMKVRIGQSIPGEQILAAPGVRDVWQVIGVRDSHEDRLTVRRVWLIGRDSGREALVLSFAAPGQSLVSDLLVGTSVDAELCFYPGVRALVSARHGVSACAPAGLTAAESLRRLTSALASDPWLESWPMLLRGSLVPGDRWHVVDAEGEALALDPRCGDQWRFLAASGGAEAVIAAEWTWAGLIPLTMFLDGEVILP